MKERLFEAKRSRAIWATAVVVVAIKVRDKSVSRLLVQNMALRSRARTESIQQLTKTSA